MGVEMLKVNDPRRRGTKMRFSAYDFDQEEEKDHLKIILTLVTAGCLLGTVFFAVRSLLDDRAPKVDKCDDQCCSDQNRQDDRWLAQRRAERDQWLQKAEEKRTSELRQEKQDRGGYYGSFTPDILQREDPNYRKSALDRKERVAAAK